MKTIDALQNSGNRLSRRRGSIFIPLGLVALLAISPNLQAVIPAPDGGYAGFNTAEGQEQPSSASTPALRTQQLVGFRSGATPIGSFNTATGAGALLFNTADANTAFGTAALLFNTTGGGNTATGAAAFLTTPLATTTRPAGLTRSLKIPRATVIRPWALARSLPIPRAASTPPSAPLCFLTTRKVTTTRPSV